MKRTCHRLRLHSNRLKCQHRILSRQERSATINKRKSMHSAHRLHLFLACHRFPTQTHRDFQQDSHPQGLPAVVHRRHSARLQRRLLKQSLNQPHSLANNSSHRRSNSNSNSNKSLPNRVASTVSSKPCFNNGHLSRATLREMRATTTLSKHRPPLRRARHQPPSIHRSRNLHRWPLNNSTRRIHRRTPTTIPSNSTRKQSEKNELFLFTC